MSTVHSTLRPRQNGHHFAHYILKYIFSYVGSLIPRVPLIKLLSELELVQIIVWHQRRQAITRTNGGFFSSHIYVTWSKSLKYAYIFVLCCAVIVAFALLWALVDLWDSFDNTVPGNFIGVGSIILFIRSLPCKKRNKQDENHIKIYVSANCAAKFVGRAG